MTEETLEKAVGIKKRLDEERDYKEKLECILEDYRSIQAGEVFNFTINLKIPQKGYKESEVISSRTAEMALLKEVEDSESRISKLKERLADLH